MHAGDLIDTASNETQWINWFKGMETSAATKNIMAAPGNHEYSGDRYMKAWKANFEYPLNQPTVETIGDMAELAEGDDEVAAQYRAYFEHWSEFAAETVYFTDYQGVRFITVNATRDTTFLTPANLPVCLATSCPSTKVGELWTEYQAKWLDHVLSTTDSKWNVVTFHQPVYSTSAGRNEPILRKYWVPVFQKHNIDLVQMGHDHTYARGYNNDDVTADAGITDGPVYIVSNSGAKHYELETDERNVWTLNGATQVLRGARRDDVPGHRRHQGHARLHVLPRGEDRRRHDRPRDRRRLRPVHGHQDRRRPQVGHRGRCRRAGPRPHPGAHARSRRPSRPRPRRLLRRRPRRRRRHRPRRL